MDTEGLKLLFALQPKWTASINASEFLSLASSDISVDKSAIKFGPYLRTIAELEWLKSDVVRLRGKARFRKQVDTITFYPGEQLPSPAALRRKRRTFQKDISRTVCAYFGARTIERQALYSDRQHGIGGAYPRFLVGRQAVIAVDPDEPAAVVNGLMRAAILWKPIIRRAVAAVVPAGREHTICARLRHMHSVRESIRWLKWTGQDIQPLDPDVHEPETHVRRYDVPEGAPEVARICDLAPGLLQPIADIAGNAISVRLRGIELARVSANGVTYPLGDPAQVLTELQELRRYGSKHPIARAHEERWLESNLIADIHRLIPSLDARYIYPQVPSFVGEERSIIDLLTITNTGRLVVIEIKASPDPDLPLQALDYWIAVEKHRESGDFQRNGYFAGRNLSDEPALLILIAPLLAYHKTTGRIMGAIPAHVPLLQIGINESWKKEIKVLRRKGALS